MRPTRLTPRLLPTPIVAGVAMPAATPPGTLSSTWYCAGGTASDGGFADHVIVIANPTDTPRRAVVTVLTGGFAPPPLVPDTTPDGSTTTTAPPATTTTVPPPGSPRPRMRWRCRPTAASASRCATLVKAPLASAIVEVEGGEIAVEHQITTLAEGGGPRDRPVQLHGGAVVVVPLGRHRTGCRASCSSS